MSYEEAKIKWVKEHIKYLGYKLSDEPYRCGYKVIETENPFGYEVLINPDTIVSRKLASINETGGITLYYPYSSERNAFIEWKQKLEAYISSLKDEHENNNDSSLRKAKIDIDVDDSKLKEIMDDIERISKKILHIKGFNEKIAQTIKNDHLINADDSAPVFKSPDDMLMYEASLLQDKIKHGEYENHDQLMNLHKAIIEINRLMKSPKFNDINFKPMTNKEMAKFVGDSIDENVKNSMQDL